MVNIYSGKTFYFSKADVISEKQQEQSLLFVKQTPCRLTHWALRRYKKQAPNNSSSECPSIEAVFPLQLCLHLWTGSLCEGNRPNHPDQVVQAREPRGAPELSPWLWVQMSNRTRLGIQTRTEKCTLTPGGLGVASSTECWHFSAVSITKTAKADLLIAAVDAEHVTAP